VIAEDGGDMGHEVIALTAAQEPGISADPAWIGRNFPASAAAEVNHDHGPMASMPGGVAWGWRCPSA
jgi:hypothetical protein